MKFPFAFVFQFGAAGIFMGKRNQLPGAVAEGAFKDVGVFVSPEHAIVTCQLAMPAIDACFHFDCSRSERKPGRTLLSFGVGLGLYFDLHVRLILARIVQDRNITQK